MRFWRRNADERSKGQPDSPGYDPAHPAVEALRNTPAADLAAHRAELQAAAHGAGMTVDEIGDLINSRPDLPRPLLAEEHATLVAVLTHADFPGRDALVDQAETARVDGLCGCGCATVSLIVDRQLPPATGRRSPIPNSPSVIDGRGEPIGGVLVFIDGGYLTSLEIYWYEDPISPFPPVDHLQF